MMMLLFINYFNYYNVLKIGSVGWKKTVSTKELFHEHFSENRFQDLTRAVQVNVQLKQFHLSEFI